MYNVNVVIGNMINIVNIIFPLLGLLLFSYAMGINMTSNIYLFEVCGFLKMKHWANKLQKRGKTAFPILNLIQLTLLAGFNLHPRPWSAVMVPET